MGLIWGVIEVSMRIIWVLSRDYRILNEKAVHDDREWIQTLQLPDVERNATRQRRALDHRGPRVFWVLDVRV